MVESILVDTNVILDIIEDEPTWADWSQHQLDLAAVQFDLVINDIVYAELSMAYQRIEDLERAIKVAGFHLAQIPREALFLAGKVFNAYKKQKGTKSNVLPDFFIGAHASVLHVPLLTRDTRRYQTYFPNVRLVTP